MAETRRLPVVLRIALLAVLLGILLSAVGDWMSVVAKSEFAARHPAQDWRNDLSMDAWLVAVVLGGSWLVGTAAAVTAAISATNGKRAGQIALTVVLAVFLAFNCQAAYGSADLSDRVTSGTSDPDFVDRNGFLPYLPATRRFFGGGLRPSGPPAE